MKFSLLFASLFLSYSASASDVRMISLEQLHTYADACNNEGGQVAARLNDTQKWMCLHFVLDRPIEDQHTLQDITTGNKFLLKESTILDYREEKVNQTCLLILSYLIDHGREIAAIPPSDHARITVHVHRRSSAISQINTLLVPMIQDFYQLSSQTDASAAMEILSDNPNDYRTKLTLTNTTEIIFRNGYDTQTFKDYDGSHIVLSLGLVMGLNPSWPSGSILLPEKFIPTDEISGIIYESRRYLQKNHLKDYLSSIVTDTNRQQKIIDIIQTNSAYQSPNKDKPFSRLTPLDTADFRLPKLLQIKTLWNPRKGDRDLRIIR